MGFNSLKLFDGRFESGPGIHCGMIGIDCSNEIARLLEAHRGVDPQVGAAGHLGRELAIEHERGVELLVDEQQIGELEAVLRAAG